MALCDLNARVTENALNHGIIDPEMIQVRCKSAAKCVSAAPFGARLIALIGVIESRWMQFALRFAFVANLPFLVANLASVQRRQNRAAEQVVEVQSISE